MRVPAVTDATTDPPSSLTVTHRLWRTSSDHSSPIASQRERRERDTPILPGDDVRVSSSLAGEREREREDDEEIAKQAAASLSHCLTVSLSVS